MLTYKNVSPAQIAALRTVLAKHGLTTIGDRGEIRKMGADVVFCYEPESKSLTVDIRKAPWVISRERFTQMIANDIEAHL